MVRLFTTVSDASCWAEAVPGSVLVGCVAAIVVVCFYGCQALYLRHFSRDERIIQAIDAVRPDRRFKRIISGMSGIDYSAGLFDRSTTDMSVKVNTSSPFWSKMNDTFQRLNQIYLMPGFIARKVETKHKAIRARRIDAAVEAGFLLYSIPDSAQFVPRDIEYDCTGISIRGMWYVPGEGKDGRRSIVRTLKLLRLLAEMKAVSAMPMSSRAKMKRIYRLYRTWAIDIKGGRIVYED